MSSLYGYHDYHGPSDNDNDDPDCNDGNCYDDDDDTGDDDYHNPLQIGYWMNNDDGGGSISPPCGTCVSTIHAMLGFLDLRTNDVLYDLGCGDGRICIEAYTKYKCAQCVGIELESDLVTKANNMISKLTMTHVERNIRSSSTTSSSRESRSRKIHILQGDLRHLLKKLVDLDPKSSSLTHSCLPEMVSRDDDQDFKKGDSHVDVVQLMMPTVIVLYLLPEAIDVLESDFITC